MSRIWPPAELPGLHIDAGQNTRPWAPEYGSWLRLPAADFRCRCGWTASASGDGVPLISESIDEHNLNCPLDEKDNHPMNRSIAAAATVLLALGTLTACGDAPEDCGTDEIAPVAATKRPGTGPQARPGTTKKPRPTATTAKPHRRHHGDLDIECGDDD
ncbi:hypothetical protein AB0K71_06040 [Streptomyces syringium]|uniref:hypothetical protein n=1 Tax=Streptomyces syringium TaxID=76729 RepID=UPI00343874FE